MVERRVLYSRAICAVSVGVKHQDSQNSFLAFLNAPTSALDQFDVSLQESNPYVMKHASLQD